MQKVLLSASAIALLIGSLNAQNVLYSEDFESGTMPSSIILHNEDGLTPASAVSSYTDAWIAVDDFSGSNYVAGSTSWYTPAGQADDWMVIPDITITNSGTVLTWRSKAQDPSFPDGYSVYVSTAGTNPSDFTTSSPVFSTSADASDWGDHSVDLSSYAGNDVNIAFRNNSSDMFILFVDDIQVVELSGTDIGITGVDITRFNEVGTTVNITGTVQNNGASTITSFDLTWDDGTNTNMETVSGVSIAPLASYTFTHGTGLSVDNPEDYNLTVTATISGDGDATNNEATALVTGYDENPDRVIVGEEATGTWCGFCPRGHVYMESMEDTYGDSWIGIAVHNSDPMEVDEYDTWMGGNVGGYPSGLVMRSGEYDPSDFETAYAAMIDGFALATVDVDAMMDLDRSVTVDVSSMFSTNTSGSDFRYSVIVVEDEVTGDGSDWAQVNYYHGGNYGPLEGAGHDWVTAGDPVPASEMVYEDVARELLNGVNGEAGSVPAMVTTTDEVTYSIDFDLNSDYNENHIRVVALLLDNTTGEIYNAGETHLVYAIEVDGETLYVQEGDTFELWDGNLVPLGTADAAAKAASLAVYPNPSNGLINLNSAALASESTISVYDMTGKLVHNEMNLGVQSGNVEINLSSLQPGLYNVVVNSDEHTLKQTISVVR